MGNTHIKFSLNTLIIDNGTKFFIYSNVNKNFKNMGLEMEFWIINIFFIKYF